MTPQQWCCVLCRPMCSVLCYSALCLCSAAAATLVKYASMAAWLSSAQLSVHMYSPDTATLHSRMSLLKLRPQSPNTQRFTTKTNTQLFTIKIPRIPELSCVCRWHVGRYSVAGPCSAAGELLGCVLPPRTSRGAGASKYTAVAPPTSSHLNKGYILHTALSHHTTSRSHSQHFNTQPTHRNTVRLFTLHFCTTYYQYGLSPSKYLQTC